MVLVFCVAKHVFLVSWDFLGISVPFQPNIRVQVSKPVITYFLNSARQAT